jgi:uncharacterized cupin superfamily protein
MRRLSLAFMLVVLAVAPGSAADVIKPVKVGAADVAGAIFKRPNTAVTEKDGQKFLDNILLMTADKKFETGMYKAGISHIDVRRNGYDVDEFMYFLKGKVTLTSADGTVQVIHRGEAVTIPRGWKGIFDSKGYTKFYVIYSAKGDVDKIE